MPRPRRVDGRGSIRADRASAFELAVRVAASLTGRRGAVGAPDTARGGEPNCVTGRRERRAGSARERAAARSARRRREARAVSFATGGARRRLRNETVAIDRSINQSLRHDDEARVRDRERVPVGDERRRQWESRGRGAFAGRWTVARRTR